MKTRKIFKLTAKELKVLRGGKITAGNAGKCNGLSTDGWGSGAARTAKTKPKIAPARPASTKKK